MKWCLVRTSASSLWAALALLLVASRPAFGQPIVASFFYDEEGRVIRQERDTNGDGHPDMIAARIIVPAEATTEDIQAAINLAGRFGFETMAATLPIVLRDNAVSQPDAIAHVVRVEPGSGLERALGAPSARPRMAILTGPSNGAGPKFDIPILTSSGSPAQNPRRSCGRSLTQALSPISPLPLRSLSCVK